MKTLSWNCQGLGNPWTVQDLYQLEKEKKPNLVFLMETKMNSKKAEKVKRSLKGDGFFVAEPVGKKGGLIMWWDQNVTAEVANYSHRHISLWIYDEKGQDKWLLTGYYGEPDGRKRSDSWKFFTLLKPERNIGWGVIGDFNELVSQDEKVGGRQRLENQMKDFREALEDGGLYDMGWRGDKFTWSNKHADETFTKERLDRVVVNAKWKSSFRESWVEVLAARCSDHRPLLWCMYQTRNNGIRRRKVFRYEASWALEEECNEVLKRVWDQVGETNLLSKLESSEVTLLKWNRIKILDSKKEIQDRTDELRLLQMNESRGNISEIKSLQKELEKLLEQKDMKWRQRAKQNWFQLGDRNTRFFHSCATQRQK
ncbi:uncharacterized protein LOC122278595 [Carya illinoinensis]|uniref:uncharacterized protein LOC122278595 n=1 Tax=Carya illinoinensis TaxID=32201 RepID=UPI001C724B4F|nr:uncharacterized protein LOC122278595 [Carya illinoinensis]